MTTEDMLVERFGVLLDLAQVAELLKRKSADSVRVALSGNTDLARQLLPAKVKIGRRILFKASVLAKILDNSHAPS
ncbi:DNA-binding protein [Massilia terrae]|uniref:DNA-binding protein n=1 Tax=Massilia terrae TaxID=1811224 RepID=A0ABT2D097_9BURK|nr:DNA-binding protein [Massilia terrae]MCS0658865.1 DNA-binding protein [Massilia terrae]